MGPPLPFPDKRKQVRAGRSPTGKGGAWKGQTGRGFSEDSVKKRVQREAETVLRSGKMTNEARGPIWSREGYPV